MSGIPTNRTNEHGADTLIAVDDTFIGRLDGVLDQAQLDILETFSGIELKLGSPPEEVCGRFAYLLNERIRTYPAYGLVQCDSLVDAEKEDGNDEDEEGVTLINLAIQRTSEDIRKCTANIRGYRPSEFRQATLIDRIASTVLKLRPDLLAEKQHRESEELKEHELKEGYRAAKRNRSFKTLVGVLEGLANDPGLELANRIPQATLLEAIERLEKEDCDSTRVNIPVLSTPSREERIRTYEPRQDYDPGVSGEVAVEEPTREQPEVTEVTKLPVRKVQIEIDWLDPTKPVDLEAIRYTGETEVDLISTLTAPMKSLASKVDRNPLNQEGLDKYQAIIDHLAKAIASGCMPWQLKGFVKPIKDKARGDYPDNVWYTFDGSPNSPRVYFTIRTPGDKEDTEQAHQLLIISETDKAHQLEVLRRITGSSRRRLRGENAGSK